MVHLSVIRLQIIMIIIIIIFMESSQKILKLNGKLPLLLGIISTLC